MTHIPQTETQTGRVYRLNSRNIKYGLAVEGGAKFVGIRRKWNSVFLDIENHWDTGAPWGTAKPVALLEEVPPAGFNYSAHSPFDESGKILFGFLNNLEQDRKEKDPD